MKRSAACALLAAGLLSACSTIRTAPVLTLSVQAIDARRARVALAPVPPAARWDVRPAAECGDVDGPPTASGLWPAPAPVLELPARPGDLVTVWAEVGGVHVQVADCPVPAHL